MAKEKSSNVAKRQTSVAKRQPARSAAIAEQGISTGQQFAALMSALMTDLVTGAITPDIGNATCNAGGKLLKIVEMQHKYRSTGGAGGTGGGDLKLI